VSKPSVKAAILSGMARGNRKLGKHGLSWSRPYWLTCPLTCKLLRKPGQPLPETLCYADTESQPPHHHPYKVSLDIPDFSLAPDRIEFIRLHVVGDFGLASDTEEDLPDLEYIAGIEAAADKTDKEIYTYCHGWRQWGDALAKLRKKIRILASCDDESDVRDSVAAGWMPAYHGKDVSVDSAYHFKAGHRLLVCPAQRRKNVTCSTCRACWGTTDRYVGIAFADH
jgi:hypothetical protein